MMDTLAKESIRREAALDQLDGHANTAGRIGDLLEQFMGRFRGCGPSTTEGPTPVPSGHAGQLERLGKNLERAEELVRELGSIG